MYHNKALRAVTGLAIATVSMAAAPALAKDATSATTAATQITGVIDTSKVAKTTTKNEFSELFASWEQLDGGARQSLVATRSAVSVPSRMPVEAVRMSSGYGMRDHPILRKRRAHNGVDLAAPSGTPVYATADGLVGKAQYWGSYGNYVQIEHGGELQSRYAHLSDYVVAAGERVQKGELIGYVGSTGRSTGPHLHYEVRIAGEAVDPRPYMLATELAVQEDVNAMGGPE